MLFYVAAVWCALIVQTLSWSIPDDEVEKRYHYVSNPISRLVEERGVMSEDLRRMFPVFQPRQKRFEGLADYVALEDPNAKRTSLKRLAILSARGFGRK